MKLAVAACIVVLASATGAAQEFAPTDPATTLATSDDVRSLDRAVRVSIGRGPAAIPWAVEALRVGRTRNREAAFTVLAHVHDPAVIDVLYRALDREDADERVDALKALARQPNVPLREGLLAAAKSRTWSVRRAAALVLANVDDPIAVVALAALTRDVDADVRGAAMDGLLHTDAPASEAIVRAFPDLDPWRREAALDALFRSDAGVDAAFCSAAADHATPASLIRSIALRARIEPGSLAGLDAQTAAFVARCAADARSDLRDPAQFVLARDREHAAPIVKRVLDAAVDDVEAAALGDALIELLGPAARAPLLDVAAHASGAASAGAVRALRRFRTARTGADLAWLYSTELPRIARDALLSAFEEWSGTDGGRSGLIAALEDKDAQLRLRAFSALVASGVREHELPLLRDRVRRELDVEVSRRMVRLLVTKASGDSARRLVYPLVSLLSVKEPARTDARDALENLKDPALREEVARLVLDRIHAPWSTEDLHLLTRLSGADADRVVATELGRAASAHETSRAKEILIQLRTGGGREAVAAARPIARDGDAALRDEALHTLLARGDAHAPAILAARWADLPSIRRSESVGLVAGDAAELAPHFREWIARETDPVVSIALVERAGELDCPVSDALIPLVESARPIELRAAALEALAAIDDAPARAAVNAAFDGAIAELGAARSRSLEEPSRLLLLTCARGVAAHGDPAHAERLARLLFAHVPELEARRNDVDGGFDFEETIAEALVLLARTAEEARSVAAALEVELDRRASGGDLFLLPKGLLLRLGRRFELADAAFRPAAAQLYESALVLPPDGLEYEPLAAVRASEAAAAEHDMARAADHLQTALAAIDRASAQDLRVLREDLGAAQPFVGYDPIARLRGERRLASAADELARGKDGDALRLVAGALAAAPFDAGFRIRVAAFLASTELDADGAVAQAMLATALAPFDAETLANAARILRAAGHEDDARPLDARLEELRGCGLAPRG